MKLKRKKEKKEKKILAAAYRLQTNAWKMPIYINTHITYYVSVKACILYNIYIYYIHTHGI
jgi:hypothetical protein